MRILFLSNFLPPARPGGYTQWCHEVAQRLAERGHTIGVLTSRYELEKAPTGEQHIYRLLYLEGDLNYYQPLHFFTGWKKQHQENLAYLEHTLKDFAPDLVFVWGMWALSKALPAGIEQFQRSGAVVSFANGRESFYVGTTMDDPSMLNRQICFNKKLAHPGAHTDHMLQL